MTATARQDAPCARACLSAAAGLAAGLLLTLAAQAGPEPNQVAISLPATPATALSPGGELLFGSAEDPMAARLDNLRPPMRPPPIQPRVDVLPADLWRELRAGMRLDHHLDEKRVRQEIAWLKRHPRYLPRLQARMSKFLGHIHGAVRARDMPAEIALLPIVESALDPYAFSHGGAAGLWQFIPATAQRFGLARNYWYDGRRDPIAATEAALDYLDYLHGLFDDWLLAVAGYNAGEGNVRRALRKLDRAGTRPAGQTAFWVADLPRETAAYVPRLLALAAVVADPEAYGLTLPEVAPKPAFATVPIDGQFDLQRIAETLSLDVDTLYDWNPALNQWATPPQGPHRLLLPHDLATGAHQALAAVPVADRVRWLRVEIRPGDTLGGLARRHGTALARIRRANGLGASPLIRAGDALLIPRAGSDGTSNPVLAARSPTGAAAHVVQSGDSLWRLSRAYDVPLDTLIRVNRVSPKEPLRLGQKLVIPGATPATAPGGGQVIRKVTYGVRPGDSLARIASRFNVGVKEIVRWNGLDIGDYLQPGQSLKLYVNVVAGD